MKQLVYTFSTFPWKDDLPFEHVHILKKINLDIKYLLSNVGTDTSSIIGIAKSPHPYSTIEASSGNTFHKKHVIAQAPNTYPLSIPKEFPSSFIIQEEPTTSFCNLSIFKIRHSIAKKYPDISCYFIHIANEDLPFLKKIIW